MRRRFRMLIFPALLAAFAPASAAGKDPVVTIAFVDDSTPAEADAYTKLAQAIADRAGFTVDTAMLPGMRILETVRLGQKPFCGMNYYRTAEREEFARFTRPIRQDPPFAVAVLREKAASVGRHKTLRSLYADESLGAPVRPKGISFGHPYLDALSGGRQVNAFNHLAPSDQLARLMASGRLDWSLQFEDGDATDIMREMGLDIVFLPMEDMPPGGTRRIMCSRAVADELMARMDAAIAELLPEIQAED